MLTLMEYDQAPKYPSKKSFFQRVLKEARQNRRPWLAFMAGREDIFNNAGVEVIAPQVDHRQKLTNPSTPLGLVWLGAGALNNDYQKITEDLELNVAADTVVFLEYAEEDDLPEGVNYIARFGHSVAFLLYPDSAGKHKAFSYPDEASDEDEE